MAKVDLSPKDLSNPAWTVTHFKSLMNVIIHIINEQLGTICCVEVCHGSHYSLVEMGSGQPSILLILSPYLTLSEYSSVEIV